jgi:hypothetical protein
MEKKYFNNEKEKGGGNNSINTRIGKRTRQRKI